jgi:geranylgeranyl diphosphate synthase, type I
MTTSQLVGNRETWAPLPEVHASIQHGMRAAVDRITEPMRRIVGYHLGWWDELQRPIEGGSGKAIHPTLTLLCAEAMGTSWKAAVAVELVHNFSLIHDDIIDGDTTRRSRSTVWSVFGVGTAILAGDALLALATQILTDNSAPVAQRAAGAAEHRSAGDDLRPGRRHRVRTPRRCQSP